MRDFGYIGSSRCNLSEMHKWARGRKDVRKGGGGEEHARGYVARARGERKGEKA